MKQKSVARVVGVVALATFLVFAACAMVPQKTEVRVLIVPKFEIGNMTGDEPGEAQLFYERYCAGCEEISIPNSTPTEHFYLNEKSGVGLLVTGSGKTAAGLSLASLLSWDAYDFANTTIVSVGCAGGSTGSRVFGDVVVVSAVVDADLGHTTDIQELAHPDSGTTWFHDESYDDYSHAQLNQELVNRAFKLAKDCPLRTTEKCRRVLAQSFPGEEWALREPCVCKGVVASTDCYWKGWTGHKNAVYIAKSYGCTDEYTVTEMEDVAVYNAARCFGLEDRVIALRVVVNMDTFLEGETPESLWLDDLTFTDRATENGSETRDIFEPGMHNLLDVGQLVIDDILR